jgi:hypothetical protein
MSSGIISELTSILKLWLAYSCRNMQEQVDSKSSSNCLIFIGKLNGLVQNLLADTLHYSYLYKVFHLQHNPNYYIWTPCRGTMKNYYKILVSKFEWKRPKHRWKATVKIDLEKKWYDSMDWIHMTHDRFQWLTLVNTVMNLLVQ